MATDIFPVYDRIAVVRETTDKMTAGGIFLPDTARDKPQIGVVHAAGDGAFTDSGVRLPMDVKPGDRILFAKHAGAEVKIDGVDYLFMRASDVIAVLD